jgi:nitronate monooxygenase
MREHEADAPSAYPDVHHLTAKIRAAARSQGDRDGFHLWAGQAHSLARTGPAGELVRELAAETREALRSAAERAR